MTPAPGNSPSPAAKKRGIPIFVWLLGGCGCLVGGGFILALIAAIALPSFLNQISKARETEAKTTLGAINRLQRAYRLENGSFSTTLADLDVPIPPSSTGFTYQLVPQPNPKISAITTATPEQPDTPLKSYTAGVFVLNPDSLDFASGICATLGPSSVPPSPLWPPGLAGAPILCPEGSALMN